MRTSFWLVCVETHYDPNGVRGRLMSALMAKRQFRYVRESALDNLKRLAQAPGDAGDFVSAGLGASSQVG